MSDLSDQMRWVALEFPTGSPGYRKCIEAVQRIEALENALIELRDNIGTGWTDDHLKAFADGVLAAGATPNNETHDAFPPDPDAMFGGPT